MYTLYVVMTRLYIDVGSARKFYFRFFKRPNQHVYTTQRQNVWVRRRKIAPLLAMMYGRVDYNLALSYCGSCTDIMAYVYCIYTISRMTISLGRIYLVKAAPSNVLPQAWIAHLHTQCKISAFATKNRLSHKS